MRRVLTDEKKRKIYDEFGSLGIKLFEDEGEDFMRAYFFWKSKKNRAVAALVFVLTFGFCGCFCCCFCFCFCCCNFCFGKFKPDLRAENLSRRGGQEQVSTLRLIYMFGIRLTNTQNVNLKVTQIIEGISQNAHS